MINLQFAMKFLSSPTIICDEPKLGIHTSIPNQMKQNKWVKMVEKQEKRSITGGGTGRKANRNL